MNTTKIRTYRHLKDYLEKLPDDYLDSKIKIEGIDAGNGIILEKREIKPTKRVLNTKWSVDSGDLPLKNDDNYIFTGQIFVFKNDKNKEEQQ